jgi:hypothetical protein
MSEKRLCDPFGKFKFKILSAETVNDTSRSSDIPLQYIKAVKVCHATLVPLAGPAVDVLWVSSCFLVGVIDMAVFL